MDANDLAAGGLKTAETDCKLAPAHPAGERVFVRPRAVEERSEGGLFTPDMAKKRMNMGTILAAGDQAADKLYDLDFRIGDEIWHGLYAGIIEEWRRIVWHGEGVGPRSVNGRGDGAPCEHDGAWDVVPKGNILGSKPDPRWQFVKHADFDTALHACRACGALRATDRVIGLMVDDIICSPTAQKRLEDGVTFRLRDMTADGRTRYVIVREKNFVDTYETAPQSVRDVYFGTEKKEAA